MTTNKTPKMIHHMAIFASGNGSNCENLIHHFSGRSDVEVALVLCNKASAPVVGRARRLGVDTVVLPKAEFGRPEVLLPVLQARHIDFIVLAGFLLMIPQWLVAAYGHRMINLHPALLPKFGGKGMYGHHVHEAVKAAGEKLTGMTVHWVSEVCDGGEIIAQFTTPVSPDDTPDDIALHEHELEMAHFPEVVERVLRSLPAR